MKVTRGIIQYNPNPRLRPQSHLPLSPACIHARRRRLRTLTRSRPDSVATRQQLALRLTVLL